LQLNEQCSFRCKIQNQLLILSLKIGIVEQGLSISMILASPNSPLTATVEVRLIIIADANGAILTAYGPLNIGLQPLLI
jgi:hypothetical protein